MATATKYQKFLKNQFNGVAPVDFDTDTFKVILYTNTGNANTASLTYLSEITSTEVSGTNYTAGGATIGSITVTESTGTTTVDGNDVSWTVSASGFSNARYAVIYKDTGSTATSPLIGYIDFGADYGNVAGTLSIEWSASGIATFA
jgi:hypothetical protein